MNLLRRVSIAAGASALFASSIGVTAAHVPDGAAHMRTPVSAPAKLAPGTPKYLVLMVLDGARPDYFGLTSLPHVNLLRRSGTQFSNVIDGILEAETPASHATIATGSRPDRAGILGFDWANNNDRYSLFSPNQMGALEQILQDNHAPTLAGLYKARFPAAKAVAISGHKYYAAAPLGGPQADAIMFYEGDPKGHYVPVAVPGHAPPTSVLKAPGLIYPTTHLRDGVEDNLATKLALAAFAKMRPRLLLMNFPEFDWPLGHVDGGIEDRAKVVTDMKGFDPDLGQIEVAYRKAGILNQTLFVITADHGMMPIKHFVSSSIIDRAVSAAGTTAPDIAASSGDFIWLTDAAKSQTVARNILAAHDPDIQSVYYLSPGRGRPSYVSASPLEPNSNFQATNQYLLGSLLNGHQPDVVVFGREGVSFTDPKTNWKADHGGNSWESQHVPLIVAGPGIRHGAVMGAAAQLDDVAPTILTDMGVNPTGMQGRVLAEAQTHPSTGSLKARRSEIRQLGPLVRALALQGRAELRTG